VNGPASSSQDPKHRAELLKRVEALHPVPKHDGAQFVAGVRLRLRRGIDQDAALRILAELQAIGASVEVEANRPPDEAILALDQFQDAEPETHDGSAVDESLLAQLQTIDETPAVIDRGATTVPGSGKPKTPVPATQAARAPEEETTAPVDEARFRPSGDWQKPMDLELERPLTPPSPPPPPVDDAAASDEDAGERPPPKVADAEWRPVPGRIANGALRKNPAMRIAVGVVGALALGWLFAQPYAHHAERRVADLRAQADAERYRPVEEAQARVRQLDRDADDAASNSALGMGVVWLLVGAAAFAGWWRAT
jgi:hypothetical protein